MLRMLIKTIDGAIGSSVRPRVRTLLDDPAKLSHTLGPLYRVVEMGTYRPEDIAKGILKSQYDPPYADGPIRVRDLKAYQKGGYSEGGEVTKRLISTTSDPVAAYRFAKDMVENVRGKEAQIIKMTPMLMNTPNVGEQRGFRGYDLSEILNPEDNSHPDQDEFALDTIQQPMMVEDVTAQVEAACSQPNVFEFD